MIGSRPAGTRRHSVAALCRGLMVLGILCTARTVDAGSGSIQTLPAPAAKPRHGLRVTVDTTWVEGYGYRPVRVRLTATAAAVADRTVTFQFRAGPRSGDADQRIEVEQNIDIPAGALTAAGVLAVPQYEKWDVISWDVWVDRQYADDLSQSFQRMPGVGYQPRASAPVVVAVGDAAEASRAMCGLIDALRLTQGGLNPPALPPGAGGAPATGSMPLPETFTVLAPNDLPRRWIDYSCLDIVCLSVDQLRQVTRRHPLAWRAIGQWINAGGTLWVYGVGERWQRIEEVEQAVGLGLVEADLAERGWEVPTGKEPLGLWQQMFQLRPGAVAGRATAGSVPAPPLAADRPTDSPGFAWRDLGLGRVIVLRAAEPFPRGDNSWEWVTGSMGFERYLWKHRHGLLPEFANGDFWNLLIPGVGLAPVTAFHALITLFVLVIGPVNYYLLHRRNRLQWLIFTVPLGAAFVTVSLFVYALMSDGLATRVRARSLTRIDQPSGKAVCWARLSYYAGLAPARGLTFPLDTVVLPLLPTEGSARLPRGRGRRSRLDMVWSEKQRLTQGWLKARSPTQYVTLRSYDTDRMLRVDEQGGLVRVENRLDTTLRHLVVADSRGRFHCAAQVRPGDTTELVSLAAVEAVKQLRLLLSEAQPRLPPGVGNVRRRRGRSRQQDHYANVQQSTSRLERVMSSLSNAPSTPGSAWQGRTYVAIAERSADNLTGLDGGAEQSSLHVILGSW